MKIIKKYSYTLGQNSYDCGIASIMTILLYFGIKPSREKIMNKTGIKQNGYSAYDLIRIGRTYGINGSGIKTSIESLKDLPAIAHTIKDKNMFHFIVILEKSGVVEIDNGAKIIRVKEETDKKDIPPLILQAGNGAYLYATSDLATIYQRMKDWNPDYIIYVVDERQSLHFEQVFRSSKKSNLTKDTILEHVKFGTINGPDGKPFKTRNGEALKLEDLIKTTKEIFINKKESNKEMKEEDIDKIVNAIIKFADLQNNRERDYIFDIDKFADVNGKTGPYLLYTAVRIKKLLEETNSKTLNQEIYNKNDKNLRMKLLEVTDVVNKAAETRMPHYIADYLYDLAVITNTFYQNNNLQNEQNKEKKETWINLLNYTYQVMEKLLKLLTIEIPSKM